MAVETVIRMTLGGGGGATDIALCGTNGSSEWNNSNHFYSRIIVAGGSGGYRTCSADKIPEFCAGGGNWNGSGTSTSPGTQISNASFKKPGFGFGGDGTSASIDSVSSGSDQGCGGGGGWYGGGSCSDGGGCWDCHGGGGSSYVLTNNSYKPTGYTIDSKYYMTNDIMISGNSLMPDVAGTGNETGHSGNGAAKITPVN